MAMTAPPSAAASVTQRPMGEAMLAHRFALTRAGPRGRRNTDLIEDPCRDGLAPLTFWQQETSTVSGARVAAHHPCPRSADPAPHPARRGAASDVHLA
jgi:hypothetical protein